MQKKRKKKIRKGVQSNISWFTISIPCLAGTRHWHLYVYVSTPSSAIFFGCSSDFETLSLPSRSSWGSWRLKIYRDQSLPRYGSVQDDLNGHGQSAPFFSGSRCLAHFSPLLSFPFISSVSLHEQESITWILINKFLSQFQNLSPCHSTLWPVQLSINLARGTTLS